MPDAVAIVPELPFAQQVREYARHLSRSIPNVTEASAREFVAELETPLKVAEGEEVPEATRQDTVRRLVGKTVELNGGLEAPKDSEVESSHLLLAYLLSSTFDQSTNEFNELSRSVIDSLKKGGEAAASSSRTNKLDTACRILNNTYNYLPPSSPLRPHSLLVLIRLLSLGSELSALPLSSSTLTEALSQWSIPPAEEASFLSAASTIYASSGSLTKALEVQLLALQQGPSADVAGRIVALALADEDRFGLDDILETEGVKGSLSGNVAEVAKFFQGSDEIEAVKAALSWQSSSGSSLESFGIPALTSDTIVRKVRLIALTTLAARSTSQQLTYQEVASALQIQEDEVEAWVIDGIQAKLIRARLSQPQALVRITYVSSRGAPAFGANEWELLEKRLTQWQTVVDDARRIVEEAEDLAAQGPITNRSRAQGGQQGHRGEEVAA